MFGSSNHQVSFCFVQQVGPSSLAFYSFPWLFWLRNGLVVTAMRSQEWMWLGNRGVLSLDFFRSAGLFWWFGGLLMIRACAVLTVVVGFCSGHSALFHGSSFVGQFKLRHAPSGFLKMTFVYVYGLCFTTCDRFQKAFWLGTEHVTEQLPNNHASMQTYPTTSIFGKHLEDFGFRPAQWLVSNGSWAPPTWERLRLSKTTVKHLFLKKTGLIVDFESGTAFVIMYCTLSSSCTAPPGMPIKWLLGWF